MKKIFVSLLSICVCLLTILQASIVFASSIIPLAKAISDNRNGAVVQWEVERESNNLGFNVYRFEKNQLILINKNIIAGSSLMNAEKVKYFKENLYSIYDSEGNLESHYLIEAIDLDGKTRKIEVQTEYVQSIAPVIEQHSAALEELSNNSENGTVVSDYPVAPADKQFSFLNENFVQNVDTQRWVAAQPGAKIAVKTDGLYRVARAQLAATNFNVNAPIANWQLYVDGIEQAIIVEPSGNYIEFYGRGTDTQYTDTKYYYLVVGTTEGRRMSVNSRKLNASLVTAPNFLNTINHKERKTYSTGILNGDVENFFGSAIVNDPASSLNVTVNIKGFDASVPQTTFSIKLHGSTRTEHSVQVKLNNTEIGTITGNGQESMQKQFTVPTSLLIDGANVFSFSTSAAGDVVLFDAINISYKRLYVADSDRLTFTTAYGRATRVQGFTSSNIRVFDISDPNGTALVAARVENNSVLIPANRPRMLLAIADEAVLQLSASAISSNAPSAFLSSAANKDLVIITHANFKALAETLAVYRRGQGLTVEVVTVEDVFDEAGFGAVTPASISSFLQSVAPKYALLIGDGTYDPRNYFGWLNFPFANYVPTRLFETNFGEAVSDDMMVDFNNDNVPDFPIGRLPVRDNAALQNIISKIQSFESTVGTALLQKGATFVSDNPEGWDFYVSNQKLRAQLPANTPVNYIKRSDGDAATVRQMITDSINGGRFIVAYSGHGQVSAWWSSSAFRTADVATLTNTVYPLFLPMNCLNGAFADAFSESLAEAMVESPNGAVAAWSSSGLTFPDSQEQMGIRFFKSIGTGEFANLGDAIKSAKNATSDADVRRSWILLGDPTLKVR